MRVLQVIHLSTLTFIILLVSLIGVIYPRVGFGVLAVLAFQFFVHRPWEPSMKEPIFDKTWLVWVKPHAGPATPQVWKHDRMCSELTVVDKHELPDGAANYLSIESLAKLYPARMRAQ